MFADRIVQRRIAELRPQKRNARTHSKKQIKQIAASIEKFGFTNPVLLNDNSEILAGHGRVEGAKRLGWSTVPTIELSHLTPIEQRAYVLADNKLALNAGWDDQLLGLELQNLSDLNFDVEITGFSIAEIDMAIDGIELGQDDEGDVDDEIPELQDKPVTQMGDLWQLGDHRLVCGDARDAKAYEQLLDGKAADMIFTDPPYNVPIDGHVSGLGKNKHREFAFASSEMSEEAFTQFLIDTLKPAANAVKDGAIAFVCMDWRHMSEILAAGKAVFDEMKNLVVWAKSNGGMGAFYRSRHELIFVFKQGTAAHTNSFGLGETGRYRTNVWEYAGMSSRGKERDEALAMHPTVKPVALVTDAIKDCSRRKEIILDQFGGSGSTLIAAERTGRHARLIEYDPHYCDTIIRRWEKLTGEDALLVATGDSFRETEQCGINPPVLEVLS
ncbi:DNA methyltransferase [Parasphingorhabdus sp. JC815]|uniref:site-specific DNA-methyltransferase n=1 Tax=Parasphingorhabdus sp. JC815 TaxID=3232140 RepID=UPI003457EF1B